MNVLVTVVVAGLLAVLVLAVYNRLVRLRDQVRLAWKRLESNQNDEAVRTVYNRHVAIYNAALGSFPANLVGPAAGFKPARVFEPRSEGSRQTAAGN